MNHLPKYPVHFGRSNGTFHELLSPNDRRPLDQIQYADATGDPFDRIPVKRPFLQAGLPEECMYVVNAEVSDIERLVSSSKFDYVSFIGLAKVGRHLRKILAPGTRLGLEHGGQGRPSSERTPT